MQGLSHVVLLLCPGCTPARDARPSLGSPAERCGGVAQDASIYLASICLASMWGLVCGTHVCVLVRRPTARAPRGNDNADHPLYLFLIAMRGPRTRGGATTINTYT